MPSVHRSKPSLETAHARADRAREHLGQLEIEIEKALKAGVTLGPSVSGLFKVTVYPLPKVIPILIGEAMYNLRMALDCLVFQLAFLDSGHVQKNTKFPILDHAEAWRNQITGAGTRKLGRWKLWLPRLTEPHLATLERLQPFSGCVWTRMLRRYSDPDRHYELVVVDTRVVARVTGDAFFPDLDDLEQHAQPVVAFDNGPPVMRTLEQLHREVTNLLRSFSRDFP
jgi:hypothetical protein